MTTEYEKKATDRISNDIEQTAHIPSYDGKLVPPPLVAAMSPEERVIAEAKMRKKIDTRLLPMIILMYIMNCGFPHKMKTRSWLMGVDLDRNNIAAVRLAGLQDELNLTSVQYQVGTDAKTLSPIPLT